MNANLIIVTGYFGAPIREKALKIAAQRDLPFVDLDAEISKRDGRSIRRLVMMNGEHGYRNCEYDLLKELSEGEDCVVACGDGVLYDDDSRSIITENDLFIAGSDLTTDELWRNALLCEDSYHAFMSFGTEEQKRSAFDTLIDRQRLLFSQVEGDLL